MAAQRITMRKIRDIPRLRFAAGLSIRQIKDSTKVSVGAIQKLLSKAQELELSWPLPEDLDDTALAGLFYPGADTRPSPRFQVPDWSAVHQELKRKRMTLQLLWEDYTGQYPNRCYCYSQFCDRYRHWRSKQKRSMRQTHKAGEKCFVDYCGQTAPIIDPGTGEIRGARPKAVVEDDDGLWIAKFNRPDDPWNCARIEHAMRILARFCGIETAESKITTIGDRDALMVKRFDREKAAGGYRRAHMINGLMLLRTEDTPQRRDRWSYVLMAEELRRICAKPQQDARELYARMCFNALISNTDDHPRNHALIARATDWKLSPAYDLTPSTPVSIERRDLALQCGDLGRYAHANNLLSQCARFTLVRDEAHAIITEMENKIKNTWYETARRMGVAERDCNNIAGAFVYPGFRLPLQDQ